jgi:hypothetical protein
MLNYVQNNLNFEYRGSTKEVMDYSQFKAEYRRKVVRGCLVQRAKV